MILLQKLRVGADAAISRNFVVLYALCRRDESRVELRRNVIFLNHFRALSYKSFHALALLAFRTFTKSFKNLFESCHMFLGVRQMLLEPSPQPRGDCGLRQLWQSFHRLIFSTVNVLEFFHTKML